MSLLLVSAGCLSVSISGVGSAGGSSTGAATSTGAPGPCTANDQCISGVCGVDGTGCCCAEACKTANETCAATACDCQTGACIYPPTGNVCDAAACSGDSLSVPLCDGAGDCVPSITGSCAPYACEDGGCLTSCGTAAQCASGFFCDTLDAACCSGLSADGTIEVDSDRGHDGTACCGLGMNQPCQTISHAMKLIESAQARDVTIDARVDGGRWDARGKETYPIVLGWGVELMAPGVTFYPGSAFTEPAEIFDVGQYSPTDTIGYASITGADGLPIDLNATYYGTAIQVVRISGHRERQDRAIVNRKIGAS